MAIPSIIPIMWEEADRKLGLETKITPENVMKAAIASRGSIGSLRVKWEIRIIKIGEVK